MNDVFLNLNQLADAIEAAKGKAELSKPERVLLLEWAYFLEVEISTLLSPEIRHEISRPTARE